MDMRRCIDLVEDVWRKFTMDDPKITIPDHDLKHVHTIDDIEIHMMETSYGFDMVFINQSPLTEFIFVDKPKDLDDPRRVGEAALYLVETIGNEPFYEFQRINLKSTMRGKGFGYKLYSWLLETKNLKTAHVLTSFSFAIWKKMANDPSKNTWWYDDQHNPHELSEIISDERDNYPPFYASTRMKP